MADKTAAKISIKSILIGILNPARTIEKKIAQGAKDSLDIINSLIELNI